MIALAILIRSLKTAVSTGVMVGVFSAVRTSYYFHLAAVWTIKRSTALIISDSFLARGTYFFFHKLYKSLSSKEVRP